VSIEPVFYGIISSVFQETNSLLPFGSLFLIDLKNYFILFMSEFSSFMLLLLLKKFMEVFDNLRSDESLLEKLCDFGSIFSMDFEKKGNLLFVSGCSEMFKLLFGLKLPLSKELLFLLSNLTLSRELIKKLVL